MKETGWRDLRTKSPQLGLVTPSEALGVCGIESAGEVVRPGGLADKLWVTLKRLA